MTRTSSPPIRLAPSDLTFLWEECQRCFWLKVRGILKRPSTPFPKVFTALDGQTKDFYFGKPTREMAEGLKPGRVTLGDRWVGSEPLSIPGHARRVTLAGRFDTALTFDDSTYGLIDFKTAVPKAEHVPFYGRQLHCYAIAAERPGEGKLQLAPISQLGILCVQPEAMVELGNGAAFKCSTHFLEVERADDAFFDFLSLVVGVLSRPEPPPPGRCGFCSYATVSSLLMVTGAYGS